MFTRTVPNIVPPEMAALLLDFKQPEIIGFMFRRNINGIFIFHGLNGLMTFNREAARVYSLKQVELYTRNKWNWGRKSKGHWVVAYA